MLRRGTTLTLVCREPIVAKSKQEVGFLSLPPELRNRIYEMVVINFEEEADDSAFIGTGLRGWHRHQHRHQEWRCQPPLTQSCRTIRSETQAMCYSGNKFFCTGPDKIFKMVVMELRAGSDIDAVSWSIRNEELLGSAGAWLRAIGRESVSLITRLEISIGSWDEYPFAEAIYDDLARCSKEVAAVLTDYLRRTNTFLPACTVFMACEEDEELRMFDAPGTWRELSLPTLAESKGWDMVV